MVKICLKFLKINFFITCKNDQRKAGECFDLLWGCLFLAWQGKLSDSMVSKGSWRLKVLCLIPVPYTWSLQLTWPWVNQAHWERPRQSVSTVLQAAQMWEYIPSKPSYFNKPWPTRMIESFSRVKYEMSPQLVQGGRNPFLPETPPCSQIHEMRPKVGAHSCSCPLHPEGA